MEPQSPTLSQVSRLMAVLDQSRMSTEQVETLVRFLEPVILGIKNGRLYHETLLAIAQGRADISIKEAVIDFDAPPIPVQGFEILPEDEQLPQRVRGLFRFDHRMIDMYLDDLQKNARAIQGVILKRKLKPVSVYGAQLLDFYLSHQHLIPEEWKGRVIFFWGTLYKHGKNICVRSIHWDGAKWIPFFSWIVDSFNGNSFALRDPRNLR